MDHFEKSTEKTPKSIKCNHIDVWVSTLVPKSENWMFYDAKQFLFLSLKLNFNAKFITNTVALSDLILPSTNGKWNKNRNTITCRHQYLSTWPTVHFASAIIHLSTFAIFSFCLFSASFPAYLVIFLIVSRISFSLGHRFKSTRRNERPAQTIEKSHCYVTKDGRRRWRQHSLWSEKRNRNDCGKTNKFYAFFFSLSVSISLFLSLLSLNCKAKNEISSSAEVEWNFRIEMKRKATTALGKGTNEMRRKQWKW